MDDIRARNLYRSYAGLSAERYRQYMYYPTTIHPYSKLRLWLDMGFVIAIIISHTLLAVHFSEKNPALTDHHDQILITSDIVNILNILVNLITGYIEGYTSQVAVLNLSKIFCHYACTYMIFDLLSAISFIPRLLRVQDVTIVCPLVGMKIFRIPALLTYLNNVMKAKRCSYATKTIIEIFVMVYLYVIWNLYLGFAMVYVSEGSYQPESPAKCGWITKAELWNATTVLRFVFALDRTVSMFRKNHIESLELYNPQECTEVVFVISWFTTELLLIHCILKYITSKLGTEASKAKYFTMITQVEMYMNQRKFPPRIKKKILKFYALRFQSNFFVESRMLNCVSGQLRGDIIMHTGGELVREMEFLKQLPRSLHLQICTKLKLVIYIAGDVIFKINTIGIPNAELCDIIMHTGGELVREMEFLKQLPRSLHLQICTKLKLVIYTAGDVIFKINTIGDCLYFIHKGTVAIYSDSGREVCHLEDGEFFGAIALVLKHKFRIASSVAVSNCELFRLDKEDFEQTVACYPTVYEYFKKVSTNRYENTCVLDEHNKSEIEMRSKKE